MKHSLKTYDLFFGSLANPNRLQILNILRKKSMNVGEISTSTGFEQTMVSHNLKRLEKCAMVSFERKGKFKYYSLNKESIKPLMDLIDKHMNKYCKHIIEGKK